MEETSEAGRCWQLTPRLSSSEPYRWYALVDLYTTPIMSPSCSAHASALLPLSCYHVHVRAQSELIFLTHLQIHLCFTGICKNQL